MKGQLFYATAKHWTDQETSIGGIVTFNPTDDGTAAGNPLFSAIYAVQFTAESNTGVVVNVPYASLKVVSGDLKTVTANVVVGTVLGILGATLLAAPDGTKVHCLIMGN
jgi:hypothetical protein